MGFKSDIEIAQEAVPQDIRDIAKKMGNKTVTTNLNKTIQICIEV